MPKKKPAKKTEYKFKRSGPTTADFCYDLSKGGYMKAEDFSDDPATQKSIKDAVALLSRCEELCEYE